jgi:hypothetical protein
MGIISQRNWPAGVTNAMLCVDARVSGMDPKSDRASIWRRQSLCSRDDLPLTASRPLRPRSGPEGSVGLAVPLGTLVSAAMPSFLARTGSASPASGPSRHVPEPGCQPQLRAPLPSPVTWCASPAAPVDGAGRRLVRASYRRSSSIRTFASSAGWANQRMSVNSDELFDARVDLVPVAFARPYARQRPPPSWRSPPLPPPRDAHAVAVYAPTAGTGAAWAGAAAGVASMGASGAAAGAGAVFVFDHRHP